MSGSYSSRLRAGGGGGGLGATTVLAAKVAFASAALAAAACMVPQLVSGADAFLWKLYLFVTVHVIIFVIWKLSDSKHFHAAQQQHKDPWAPSPLHHPAAAAPPLMTEQAVLAAVRRKVEFAPAPAPAVVSAAPAEVYRVPPPVSPWHEAADSAVVEEVVSPVSCGGESCVTTESEEDASSAAASAYIATADASRSVSPARERAVLERGISLPPRKATAPTDQHFDGADNNHDGGGGDDDDLDATWNAIMQKTRPATAPAASTTSPPAPRSSPPRPSPSPRPRAREPSVGAAELSKRSEDFIKKIHNSFGRHQ